MVSPRDQINRLLKLRNPDLLYKNLYKKYYYFCQEYKNYFEVIISLGHNRIAFCCRIFVRSYLKPMAIVKDSNLIKINLPLLFKTNSRPFSEKV